MANQSPTMGSYLHYGILSKLHSPVPWDLGGGHMVGQKMVAPLSRLLSPRARRSPSLRSPTAILGTRLLLATSPSPSSSR